MSTVLVVANTTDPDPGYVGDRFVERGFTPRTVFRDRSETPPTVPDGVRVVLLLGSDWSVADPVDPGALLAECALVRSAAAAGVPVLGLCYGAQVVAHALGGRVRHAPRPEVGLVPVDTRDERLVPAGPWWEFHSDVIDPPPGATVVATNGCGVQAFTVPGMLAVQFHPEVRVEVLRRWFEELPDVVALAGADPDALLAEASASADTSRAAAHRLVDDFLASVPAGG